MFMSISAMSFSAEKKFTLVIDAGHGGHDTGAMGAFSKEKDINLNVALAFGRYVENNCPDVKVIYTRKTDVFIPLHKRASIANKNKADVFISIHTNALPQGRIARGLETYTMGMRRSDEKLTAAKRENAVIMIEEDYKEHYEGYDPDSPESTIMFEFIHDANMSKSVELAKYVQNSVCRTAGRQDKGVKQDVFLVLRETSMPACLIELGFISTPDEERYLNNKTNVDNMGRGIYEAFVKFKNKYNKGFTVPYNSSENDEVNIPTVVPVEEKTETRKTERKKTRQVKSSSQDEETRTVQKSSSERVQETQEKKEDSRQDTKDEQTNQSSQPVFKVQIMASTKVLKNNSSLFKGLENIESYNEGGYVKYTYGASTNYNEIYRLRKSILDKFPEAFIIAFKNGEKMNVSQAIKEFKANRR